MSKILCKKFNSLDAFVNAKVDDYLEIKDIGIATAQSLVSYFEENKELIEYLTKEIGIKVDIIDFTHAMKVLEINEMENIITLI